MGLRAESREMETEFQLMEGWFGLVWRWWSEPPETGDRVIGTVLAIRAGTYKQLGLPGWVNNRKGVEYG
jgi:hypothetical protein